MAHVIAVAVKGGVGKTTLAGLVIQYLVQARKNPILAVDADANSNLNEELICSDVFLLVSNIRV